jgi:hypothetical protein
MGLMGKPPYEWNVLVDRVRDEKFLARMRSRGQQNYCAAIFSSHPYIGSSEYGLRSGLMGLIFDPAETIRNQILSLPAAV